MYIYIFMLKLICSMGSNKCNNIVFNILIHTELYIKSHRNILNNNL